MKSGKLLTGLPVLLCLIQVYAFWRMPCLSNSLARLDPLMSFDEVSQHVHTIHGSGGFSDTATYEDLRNNSCTSCAVAEDHSAYWTPALYFQYEATGNFEIVPQDIGGMLAYYFLNGENITGFPAGFRMIAGNSLRRNYTAGDGNPAKPDPPQSDWGYLNQTDQYTLSQRAIGFNCLWYHNPNGNEGSLYRHFLPDKSYLDANCPDGLRLELMFPSCWNGKDIDSPDHKSHVAYPDLVKEGNCPEGFDVRFPGLFYETIWRTDHFKGQAGKFVISNGDPLGYGYHGDFMSGWDQDELQQAVDVCTNLSGIITDCPVFTTIHETQCAVPVPSAIAKENVVNPPSSLPGNVVIQYGPQQATVGPQAGVTTSPTTPVAVPTLSFSPATGSLGGNAPAATAAATEGGVPQPATPTTPAVPTTPVTLATSVVASSALPSGIAAQFTIAKAVGPGGGAAASSSVDSAPSIPAPAISSPATTVAPVLSLPGAVYDTISTQYITNGAVVSELIWEEAIVYVTETDAVTSTVLVTAAGAHRARRGAHVHRHRHAHRHLQ